MTLCEVVVALQACEVLHSLDKMVEGVEKVQELLCE